MNQKVIFPLYLSIFLICGTSTLWGMEAKSDQPLNTVRTSITDLHKMYENNKHETADALGVSVDELTAFFCDSYSPVANYCFGDDMGSISPLTTQFIDDVGKEILWSEIDEKPFVNPAILVAGAGLGRNLPEILDTIPHAIIYVNDINPANYKVLEAIKNYWAQTKYKENRLLAQQWSRLQFIGGDASQLQFPNEYFDAILADNVLHFMSPTQIIDFFENALRWLKPNGKFKIAAKTPNSGVSEKDKGRILYAQKKLTAMEGQSPTLDTEVNALLYADHWVVLKQNIKDLTFLNINPLEFDYHMLFLKYPINNTMFTSDLLQKLQRFSGFSFHKNISFYNLTYMPTVNNSSSTRFNLIENEDDPMATYVSAVFVKPALRAASNFDALRALAVQDKKNLHAMMDSRYLILHPETGEVYIVMPEINSEYRLHNICIAKMQLQWARNRFQFEKCVDIWTGN